MNVAVLSESPADEAAVKILVEGILSQETTAVAPPRLRTRGWPSVLHILPTVIRHLHYQTDAEALTVVVDGNGSPLHEQGHDPPNKPDERCRLCQLRQVASKVTEQLSPVHGQSLLKTAIGVAYPAIEAWFRCGKNPHMNEATWSNSLQSGEYGFTTSSLKKEVYGTNRPSLEIETKHAIEEATRLVENLEAFENSFPNGFGSLAIDVRQW